MNFFSLIFDPFTVSNYAADRKTKSRKFESLKNFFNKQSIKLKFNMIKQSIFFLLSPDIFAGFGSSSDDRNITKCTYKTEYLVEVNNWSSHLPEKSLYVFGSVVERFLYFFKYSMNSLFDK